MLCWMMPLACLPAQFRKGGPASGGRRHPRLLPPGRKRGVLTRARRKDSERTYEKRPRRLPAPWRRLYETGTHGGLGEGGAALNTLLPSVCLAEGAGVRRASLEPEDRWQPSPGWLGLAEIVGLASTGERKDCPTVGNINKFPKAGRSCLPRRPERSACETPPCEPRWLRQQISTQWVLSLGCPHPFSLILAQSGSCRSHTRAGSGHFPAPLPPHLLNG